MSTATYSDILDAVASYYGSGSDQWLKVAQYGIATEEGRQIIKQVPGVNVTYSSSGNVLGWNITQPFESPVNPASLIDSNVQAGSYGAGSFSSQIPATVVETTPPTVPPTQTLASGAKTVSSGATVASVMDTISLGLAGVAIGTKLGKFIDSALYRANPQWWDEHFPTINPETWANLTTNRVGKSLICGIFGISGNDTTMYVDEELLAYTYMMLLANGAYSSNYNTDQSRVPRSYLSYPDTEYNINVNKTISGIYQGWTTRNYEWGFASGDGYVIAYADNANPNGSGVVYFCSKNPNCVGYTIENGSRVESAVNRTLTVDGQTIYYTNSPNGFSDSSVFTFYGTGRSYASARPETWQDAIKIALFGTEATSDLDGVSNNPKSHLYIDPSLISGTTVQEVLASLKSVYPGLFNDSIYQDILQQDGTSTRKNYVPVPYPDMTNPDQPISEDVPGVDPQTNPKVNPDIRDDTTIEDLIKKIIKDLENPPETDEGETPPVVTPTGTANALYSVYNPTQAELNSFGAWLWSSSFVDQLLKLFNDPMQAIIGLHKVFVTPPTNGTGPIKVGYLSSGVNANLVDGQYVDIDCGSVSVNEYFGNVFDYDPFTQIYIYLPFIGIEKLDTGDVMRSTIKVIYHVDVITGACLAEIRVTRDMNTAVLYTYSGNCAVQYPISSGSYMGIVASLASIAGGVVGTVASGGALAPVAMGAVGGVLSAHTRVQHSGGFSGNSGAMGSKKPYLIITRPQTAMAEKINEFDGYPANKLSTIGACHGFTKCLECHVENIPATDIELSEIETLLKTGIIV